MSSEYVNKSLHAFNADINIDTLILDYLGDFGCLDDVSHRERLQGCLSRSSLSDVKRDDMRQNG